jgi:hypothetical protein
MLTNLIYKRLADKSAFVVFDKDTYKTLVIQLPIAFGLLREEHPNLEEEAFIHLNEEAQIKLLSALTLQDFIE